MIIIINIQILTLSIVTEVITLRKEISSKLVWIVGNQQIQLKKYHMSCFTCHMSENDFDVVQELKLLKNLKRWNQPGELTRE